jgi:ParB family chromosome partitioning protein
MAPQTKGKLHKFGEHFAKSVERQGESFKPHATTPQVADIPEETAQEEIWVDVELIDDNPYQPRLSMTNEDQADLVEKINADGQLQAGKVRPHPTRKGRYQLVFAHRRKYAVKDGYLKADPKGGPPRRIYANAGTGLPDAQQYIGKLRVRLVRDVSELEMRRQAFSENDSRVDLKPLEYARFYSDTRDDLTADWRKQGILGVYKTGPLKGQPKSATWRDVAAFLKKPLSTVYQTVRLLELPEAIQKGIEKGDLNENHGQALLMLAPWEVQQEALLKDIKKSGISGAAAVKEATRRKDFLLEKLPNAKASAQEQEDAQVARDSANFDPEAEEQALARRAEIASVMQTPEQAAAAALGAAPGEVEASQAFLDLAAKAILSGVGLPPKEIEEVLKVGGTGGNHGAHYHGPTASALAGANDAQAPSTDLTPEAKAELAQRMGLAQSANLAMETVAEEFKQENLQVTPPAPPATTGTNGVAQIPRLPQLTRYHVEQAVLNLEWASNGFDVLSVAEEDLAFFEEHIVQVEAHARKLREILRRHRKPE